MSKIILITLATLLLVQGIIATPRFLRDISESSESQESHEQKKDVKTSPSPNQDALGRVERDAETPDDVGKSVDELFSAFSLKFEEFTANVESNPLFKNFTSAFQSLKDEVVKKLN